MSFTVAKFSTPCETKEPGDSFVGGGLAWRGVCVLENLW